MKIVSICILRMVNLKENQKPIIICGDFDLSDYSYFQRSGVKEFCQFFSRTLAERVKLGTRQQFEKKGYFCYCHPRSGGFCGVMITDKDYPSRVAFTVLYNVLMGFEKEVDPKEWREAENDFSVKYGPLTEKMKKFQQPDEEDPVLKIKNELKQVETILNQALEDCMGKGEKLDDLMKESGDLSYMSKRFYHDSADKNSCCIIQ